jgi:hypothetical protein
VAGPGQLSDSICRCLADSSDNKNSICPSFAATSISPLATGLPLSARRCATASWSLGSQLSPHTASVGQAITPPWRSALTAACRWCGLGGRGKVSLSRFLAVPHPWRRFPAHSMHAHHSTPARAAYRSTTAFEQPDRLRFLRRPCR